MKAAVTVDPHCHCHAFALLRSGFTATLLITFEIWVSNFHSQLSLVNVNPMVLDWTFSCWFGKLGRACKLRQIFMERFKTGPETTKIRSNPHHCCLSIAWNQREWQQCQHQYYSKCNVLKFVQYKVCIRLLLEKELLWWYMSQFGGEDESINNTNQEYEKTLLLECNIRKDTNRRWKESTIQLCETA